MTKKWDNFFLDVWEILSRLGIRARRRPQALLHGTPKLSRLSKLLYHYLGNEMKT